MPIKVRETLETLEEPTVVQFKSEAKGSVARSVWMKRRCVTALSIQISPQASTEREVRCPGATQSYRVRCTQEIDNNAHAAP